MKTFEVTICDRCRAESQTEVASEGAALVSEGFHLCSACLDAECDAAGAGMKTLRTVVGFFAVALLVLLVALLLSGCATWCRVASGSVVIAEGLVQRWTAITRNACIADSDDPRCKEAGEYLTKAWAALLAARAAAVPCGPEDPAGFTLARVDPDVDLDALEKELDRLEKAAKNWPKLKGWKK